jgi:hypothetical protein
MDAIGLLEEKLDDILNDATEKMARSHLKHYEMKGSGQTRDRLRTLCGALLESLQKDSRTPMIRYAEKIGDERFSAGFALGQVQTAFNVLEESIWEQILKGMKPDECGRRRVNKRGAQNRKRRCSPYIFLARFHSSLGIEAPQAVRPLLLP